MECMAGDTLESSSQTYLICPIPIHTLLRAAHGPGLGLTQISIPVPLLAATQLGRLGERYHAFAVEWTEPNPSRGSRQLTTGWAEAVLGGVCQLRLFLGLCVDVSCTLVYRESGLVYVCVLGVELADRTLCRVLATWWSEKIGSMIPWCNR